MSLDSAVEHVLHRLSAAQVEALAAAAEGLVSPGGALGAAVVGASPGRRPPSPRWPSTGRPRPR